MNAARPNAHTLLWPADSARNSRAGSILPAHAPRQIIACPTIELCDGRPSMVEDSLDEWIDVVGRFCPWGASLISVDDLR